jgi:hypothetical protein
MKYLHSTVLCLACLATPMAAHAADPMLPEFDAANFATPKANPYFPLDTGVSHTLKGTRTDGDPVVEHSTLTVHGPGPMIMGVPTVLVIDEAFEDGALVERTFDYFAADKDGNVWYFGEDVTNYRYDDAGALIGTDDKSAWRAGVNDALPGISVLGAPTVGMKQFQEHAPADEAMDYAEVLATDLDITVPGGSFKNVLKTFEGSLAEPDLREFKYYAQGIGMIRADEELTEALDNPAIIVELAE